MVVGTLSLVQKGQTSGCSVQWTQWNSGIWLWGHCLWCKKAKDNVPTTIYHYSTAYYIHCILWFDFFAPKTMSSPPYTSMPLCTSSTASSGLTFLHQRQCPHHHIPLGTVYCIHWFDFFAPTPTVYCVPHCMGLTFLH